MPQSLVLFTFSVLSIPTGDKNKLNKRQGKHSFFLKIGEQAISCLKAAIKSDISRPEIQRRIDNSDEARARGISLGEFRTQQLLEALHRNIDTVTAAKSAQWYCFMQIYLPRCLNREIVEG